jgi:hypothetical protein
MSGIHQCWDCERTLQEAIALKLLPDGKAECADCTEKWEEHVEKHPELRDIYTPASELKPLEA